MELVRFGPDHMCYPWKDRPQMMKFLMLMEVGHLQVESLPSPGSVPPVEDHCIAVGVNRDPRELTKCLGCFCCGPVRVDAQV